MRTITTAVYTYAELSEQAQEKARDWYREISAGDNFYAEYIFDDAATIAGYMGIDICQTRVKRPADYKGAPEYKPTIYFSGFSSQGDGACFEGEWRAKGVQPGKVQEYAPQDTELHGIAAEFERLALLAPTGRFSVKHSGHYCHEMCTDFSFEDLLPEYDDGEIRTVAEWAVIDARRGGIESDLKDAARSLMQWIYRQLEKEYKFQNSDETVAENIIANEYEFTAEGVQS